MADKKPVGDVVLAALKPDPTTPGAFVLPDAAVAAVLQAVVDHRADGTEAFVAAVGDLLAAALTLGEDPAAPSTGHPATRTLLALLSLLQPLVVELPGIEAQRLQHKRDSAGAKFKDFAGEKERVTQVLDSGARPAGTTAASPWPASPC